MDKKSGHISLYDYLNIGVWSYDKPFFNLYRYVNYLNFLKSLNIEGVNFESSLSKFGSGIQQYFILKFLCDPYLSIDDELDQFCKNNFGPAAPPIKKLLKEWYFSDVHLQTNYDYASFYEDELGRFVQYITDAENSAGLSTEIKKRIDELKAYTVYLCKYYELFTELKSTRDYIADPSLRLKKIDELLTYTWQLYFTKIFQNTQLNDVLKRHLGDDQQKEKWNYAKSDHFKNITADAGSIVKKEFEKAKLKYLPLAAPVYAVTDSFLAANIKYSADSIKIATTDEKSTAFFVYPIEFYCETPGVLRIRYQADSSLLKNKPDKVAMINVESADYSLIKTDIIYKENSNGIVSYDIPAKGHYRLYLSQFNATHVSYIIYPGENLFYHNKKSMPMNQILLQDPSIKNAYPNKWLAFYAAPVDSIYFSNIFLDSKNTSRLYTQTGTSINVKENKTGLYNAAAIPKDQRNHFIFYENSYYRWPPVLKNTTPYYFFLKYPIR